ncbi:hypothetical protein COCC4DRAFT_187324 [Bipolaris maydis ATCC 48331]|uniref:40S ribosomal protein S12 n=1 Tax=Cochliobolus heterostrophus (strain C4 / ATCC 48331 / race T) TaxID=665024 RepID=N4XLG0_COCH4|nr:uncharacterized protein COCC4DRAFT_187324 [Bipolaris maydis ATCC 48331]KAJ5058202.1 hypothetical protein J3E74DRAFT_248605 [Bipolaris maydis]ENI09478.1 hypothetical protein COCC4DRAFT_187324 [Bipolaris maydis ATCC 48331]KAJ6195451.1 hypothetical protein J3E72DRAFT_246541 [Bipolaris maydis]KAJ6268944.1 hypothetical protein PSV08DRAFT_205736 [Bipolaris maydis]KAJ6279753.1 hypothetical protein J3E71DRAFT_221065 [Bipolaris maydis]
MAALASSRHTAAPIQQLTPPSSSHGGRGSWDFAVPVNGLRESLDQEHHMSEYGAYTHGAHQSYSSQVNGFAQPVRSPTWGSQDQSRSQPVSDRVDELHKKKSGEMIASNTDQDSVLEYYKTHTNNKRGPSSIKGKPKKKTSKGGQSDPEYDENNWIHRDKLKEIETRELEEAGFRVGRSSRSNSRSQSTSRRARDRTNSESTEQSKNGDERSEPRKRVSTIPAGDEEAYENHHTTSPTPQDDTVEFQPTSSKGNHTVRPSTSRIPLPKTSGIPVPSSVADRDAPLPRSRAGSTHLNGESIATMGARVRSGSVGSQVLLDDYEDGQERTLHGHRRNTSTGSYSPPKSPQKSPVKKPAGKQNPSASRKTSVQKKQTKSRTTSSTSPPNKRPGTSGGMATRPTTAHRPEGEAPWIASMYKPDPRLPPDQQIIPTHAKRMQQEQWENEGRVGSMYDKDFRLLNDDPMVSKRLSQLANLDPIAIEKAREEEAWPLPSPTKQESSSNEKGDTNTAKSPTMEQSAYKLTPTIPQGADRAPSPKLAPPITPAQPKPEVTRVSEPKEEVKEKKGLCCISDGEDDTKSQVSAAAEVEVSADASGGKGQMSVLEALKGVLKLALIHDGLARGLREASKALDRREAHMCVLNEACEEEAYKKLVVALCSEHKIPLIKVPDGKQLGEWAGLCQIDREGNPRKVVNCSCVVVKDWGEESQERSILLNYFQTEQ